MPKFSAYLRGEGTLGPTGPTGEVGPAGPSQTIFFDVDVTTGELIMYSDHNIFENRFSLDDNTGHLWITTS